MIRTIHRYLDANPVKRDDRALILGTIHPHRTERFQIDFFYGNRNSLWQILAKAFPHLRWDSEENIQHTLANHQIWISDIIRECERSDEKVTADSQLQNLILNTHQIENGLKSAPIETIYFTSGFGKNNAARLFCDAFHIKAERKDDREFNIPKKYFGRKIRGVVLISPSGIANRGLYQDPRFLKDKEKYLTLPQPYQEFKLDVYRRQLGPIFSR